MDSPRSEHGGFRYEATGQIYLSSQGLTLASHANDTDTTRAYTLESIAEEGFGGAEEIFYDDEEGTVFLEGEEAAMAGDDRCRLDSQGSITSDDQKQGEPSVSVRRFEDIRTYIIPRRFGSIWSGG